VNTPPPPLRAKLSGERAVSDWRSLRPHHDRQALYLVSDDLDLLDAAEAVVTDDSARVSEWLVRGQLSRPREDQVAAWTEDPDTPFEFLIVQPYVLAGEIGVPGNTSAD
jgi:hypothetical protein